MAQECLDKFLHYARTGESTLEADAGLLLISRVLVGMHNFLYVKEDADAKKIEEMKKNYFG